MSWNAQFQSGKRYTSLWITRFVLCHDLIWYRWVSCWTDCRAHFDLSTYRKTIRREAPHGKRMQTLIPIQAPVSHQHQCREFTSLFLIDNDLCWSKYATPWPIPSMPNWNGMSRHGLEPCIAHSNELQKDSFLLYVKYDFQRLLRISSIHANLGTISQFREQYPMF